MLVTLTIASLGTLILASVLTWSSSNAKLTDRNNEFFTTSYAAEAATEKVLARICRDYKNYGEGLVYSKILEYSATVPTASDDPYWSNYGFSNGAEVNGRITLARVNPTNVIELGPPYQGLNAYGATYQIIANAKNNVSQKGIAGAVGQEINLGTIPIFQFAIFYEDDLEINPGPVMNVTGPVHGNSQIYLQPQAALTFSSDISASEDIIMGKKPGDPSNRSPGTVNFLDHHISGVSPLILPVGTNTTGNAQNARDNVRAILEIPPSSESPSSVAGTNRLYNKADLILLISNNLVVARSGVAVDDSATVIPTDEWKLFLRTNDSFYNKRESSDVQGASIDVNKLRLWSQTNSTLRSALGGRDLSSVFIADLRPTSNSVVLTNITITTNYTFITNTTPTTSLTLPASDTYLGTVNNTTYNTNSSPPRPSSPPAMNVVTNTASTTSSSPPAAGTYAGSVTTNTTTKTSNTHPSAGTYVPPVTTNTSGKKYTYNQINNYTYSLINSYSYSLPAFAYNRITGTTTNLSKSTNYYYSTNFNVFAESGIVLTNGRALPSLGLTVVTPNPIYIMGDYNTSLDGTTFYAGTSDTSRTRPAAVMADAITILSTAWNPAKSSQTIANRVAADTTVNAAILSGIVPTGGGYYSGGVENFPRFLENWSGKKFTYNGSMVAMFNSQVATAPWGGGDVYNPPNRNWAFDRNFQDPRKLPPLTPQVLSVTRGRWSLLKPNTTQF